MVCLCGVFIIFFIYFGTWMLSNGITMSNSRLQIGRILTIDLIGQKMCENQCLTYPNCKAINFNKRHLSCELLTHSGQEAPEQLHFEENTVHIYNITKSQLSNLCANKTCPAHHRCVASKTKALCIVTDCPTTDLELINGNFSGPTINVGENLHFMCHQGFSKPIVNLTCQGSGEIQNVDRMACYKKDGHWTLAYIIQSNSGVNPLDAYLNSGIQQERNASFPASCIAMTKVPGCSTPYRAGLIDDWEKLNITEIRFTVTFPNSTQEIIFDGIGSNLTNWFSADRVNSSSWSDLSPTGSYLYFTMFGLQDFFVNRLWSIMKLHSSCPGDIGWFTGSFEPPGGCLYDLTTGSYPVFRACPGNISCLMESETIEAETIAVSVMADHLN